MIPGMAFFYGGLVRSEHSVSTMLKNYIVFGPCALMWLFVGNSLVFSGDNWGLIGNVDFFDIESLTLKDSIFSLYQMMFSLLSVAIISGGIVERIRFKFWVMFGVAWSFFIYYPIAHWIWGDNGWIYNLGGRDFAGGLVVHISTGFTALVFAKKIGRRKDFFKLKKSYNIGLVFLGTAILWVGWIGFNAGSALAFDKVAIIAIINSFISVFAGITTWLIIDTNFTPHRVSAKGICISVICSLVGITPAAGYIPFWGALVIGSVTCVLCNFGIRYFHSIFKIDDTCEVFVTHGLGGIVGAVLTGLLASNTINVNIPIENSVLHGNIVGSVAVAIYSMIGTSLIIRVLSKITDMRVSNVNEDLGLDLTEHGESVIVVKSMYR
jgi:Amt family ammonium transporter